LKKEQNRLRKKYLSGQGSDLQKAKDIYEGAYYKLLSFLELTPLFVSLDLQGKHEVSTSSVKSIIKHVKVIRQLRQWFPNTIDDALAEIEEYFDGLLEGNTGEVNKIVTSRNVKTADAKAKGMFSKLLC
jgi:hypothetical protein